METFPQSKPPPPGFTEEDITSAAKVNLGLFGVAVEYTFIVKPMPIVNLELKRRNVSDIFSDATQIKVCVIKFIPTMHVLKL